ncbi:TMEM175 family protein [Humibacter sp.]|uniref:TMEM175 family protein n=1 Tax=Humibacter sp. TaxID=1940291 RepID=UPI002BEDB8DE|nr:TMEM175 family protein [Humibacter sp.]HVX08782.1 TMEM175 family protein [Humibacter sp.]
MSEEAGNDAVQAENVENYFSADRAKAFVDAVVAIALTLLILPLLDSLTELTRPGGESEASASSWFAGNQFLLLSFLISFGVIAMFWINHHRMYARVRLVTTGLLWLNVAWLLTIVWLPVATAMTNLPDGDDALVKVAYIGTMALTSLLGFCQDLFLSAHPRLHDITRIALLRGMAVNLAMSILFVVSLILSIVVPELSYYALFLLGIAGLVARLLDRMLGVPQPAK